MGKQRKPEPRAKKQIRYTGPQNLEEYFAKSEAFQDRWNNVTHVISRMRADRISLRKASKEFGLTPRTVIRWGGSALRKNSNGQYAAKASDRLLRVLVIPTSNGLQEVGVKNSRHASDLGKYWDAVQDYLETGEVSGLAKFRQVRIKDANSLQIPLITDVAELDRLGSAGVLSFESLYAKAA